MPEVGSLNQRTIQETHTEVVSETLIFSDVDKNENFIPEDHVIFVVPESSDLVTTDGDETTRFVIPSSQGDVSGSSFDTSELRETIKSNFLVIAKLLPSKSPPHLVPLAVKESNGVVKEAADEGIVIQRLTNLPKPLLPKPTPTKTSRQPKGPRQSNGKNLSSVKQESPEIFGKMFPASYNEVLLKQIREIIYFKCGNDTTDDTEVIQGIICPHCRKKFTSMNKLKYHLQNCHTYSTTKRKSSCPSGKNVIKKMLYRCQYCDEAFISSGMRESHECSLAAKPLEHLGDTTQSHPNTCSICNQEFGSRSELSIHQEQDHPTSSKVQNEVLSPLEAAAPVPPKPLLPSISKYVSCKVCNKEISVSILEEHLKRHQEKEKPPSVSAPPPSLSEQVKKCVKCKLNAAKPPNSRHCEDCQDSDDEPVICPICDIEIESAKLDVHVNTHYPRKSTPTKDHQPPDPGFLIILCSNCGEEFKLQAGEKTNKCKYCR